VTNADNPLYNHHRMIAIMGGKSAALIEHSVALRRDARDLVAASRSLRASSKAFLEGLDAMNPLRAGEVPPGIQRASGFAVDPPESRGRVVRADTPPRHDVQPDGREVLWMLSREGATALRAELVGLIDAVELEIFGGPLMRRRWRFLRDTTARHYADRLRKRLVGRGFVDRRGPNRTHAWVQ
jgi:hypothetical protein